jgi:hypothetical protein
MEAADIEVSEQAKNYIVKNGGKITIDMEIHHIACG